MDKTRIINDYLEGKRPMEQTSWELPTDDELRHAEKEYARLLAGMTRPRRRMSPHALSWTAVAAAVVLTAMLSLWLWKESAAEPRPMVHETTLPATPARTRPAPVQQNESHQLMAGKTFSQTKQDVSQRQARQPAKASTKKHPTEPEAAAPAEEITVLTNATDSLNYYMARLEKAMRAIESSVFLAEAERIVLADMRMLQIAEQAAENQTQYDIQLFHTSDSIIMYTAR